MAFFKKSGAANDMDTPSTVIGKGVYLEAGRMTGDESVRIDGIYKGNIEINGSLVLGDSGSITGDVSAAYFLVAGEVTGNINCDTLLHFAHTCKVTGDVQTASLIIDEGAQISGRFAVSGARASHTALGVDDSRTDRPRISDRNKNFDE